MNNDYYYQSPEIWGKHVWFTIESIIAAYNPLDNLEREALEMFLTSFAALLPCLECRKHYLNYISMNNLPLDNKPKIWEWIYELQKQISLRNGKERFPVLDDWLKHINVKLNIGNNR